MKSQTTLGRRLSAIAAAAMLVVCAPPAFAQEIATRIDAGDTAWMISATALVLMMTLPGLALFYCGMVRKKNVLATMAQSLACVMLCSLLWFAVGYSLSFVGDGPWLGARRGFHAVQPRQLTRRAAPGVHHHGAREGAWRVARPE